MVRKVVKYSRCSGFGLPAALGFRLRFCIRFLYQSFRRSRHDKSIYLFSALWLLSASAVRSPSLLRSPLLLPARRASTAPLALFRCTGLLIAPVPAVASSLLLDPTQPPHPAELQPRTAPGQAARFVRPQLHNSLNPISIP